MATKPKSPNDTSVREVGPAEAAFAAMPSPATTTLEPQPVPELTPLPSAPSNTVIVSVDALAAMQAQIDLLRTELAARPVQAPARAEALAADRGVLGDGGKAAFEEWERQKADRDARREFVARTSPATVVPGSDEMIDFDTEVAQMLSAAQQATADEAQRLAAIANEEYQYFVKCRYHTPNESAHGIFLVRLPGPGETIRMSDWYARYKPKPTDVFVGQVRCQACFQKGVINDLDIMPVGERGEFKVSERWLWRRPRKPERLKAEGETRARDGQSQTGNAGRGQAMERAVLAGMEAIP